MRLLAYALAAVSITLVACSTVHQPGLQLSQTSIERLDIGTLPQIIQPLTPATRHINSEIEAYVARWNAFATDCVAGKADADASMGFRTPFVSDEVVAIVVNEDGFCAGAAHGFLNEVPLVYDVHSGGYYDFSKAFSAIEIKKFNDPPGVAELMDGDNIGRYVSTVLNDYYLKNWPRDEQGESLESCIPHLEYLTMWPSAEENALILFPLIDQVSPPCAEEVSAPIEMLEAWGFDPSLLNALKAEQ